ncbi:MAG: helix-turn-helix transcriptional regulator [Phycisphaerae bacterium]|nr:helix-turn-helix transcriptional regulator [Phycisphaerae bacterium]
MPPTTDQDLYSGLIRLHILHHASEKPVYGLWIIEELGRHGYKLSAGTLYPLLHRLEKRGLLESTSERVGRRSRRLYEITPVGRTALKAAKQKVKELFGELFESELHHVFGHREHAKREPARERPPTGGGDRTAKASRKEATRRRSPGQRHDRKRTAK